MANRMSSPNYEIAHVLERNREHLADHCANSWQVRTLHALRKCRTAALGGHIDRCDNVACQKLHLSYNSCRNRHCPKCQGHKKEEWIKAREADLLKVSYFHAVFTLPCELNRLCLYQPKLVYRLLFKTAWSVVQDFGGNPKFLGAKMGMIAILHTWGQNLSLHPHLHCIVPGGGITKSGKWKPTKSKGKYLFPVKAMSKVFRARFVAGIRKELGKSQPVSFYESLFKNQWAVYCKRPFFGPSQVIEYLGRYTHKIAISNHRIKSLEDGNVRFMVKEYRHGGKKSILSLSDAEFIRRFSLHILPKGFTRIRHYGILSSYYKRTVIPALQDVLGKPEVPDATPSLHRRCPACRKGNLVTIATFPARGPPADWREQIEKHISIPI